MVVARLAEELGRAEIMGIGGEYVDAIETTTDGAVRVFVVPQHTVVDASDGATAQAQPSAVGRAGATGCGVAYRLDMEHAGARERDAILANHRIGG